MFGKKTLLKGRLRLIAAAAVIVGMVSTGRAAWTVTNLHPPGATYSTAVSVHSGQQVGHVIVGGVRHASLWNGTAATWTDLHPPGANWSEAVDVYVGQQVGHARIGDVFQPFRASLWSGTAASRIDLHPAAASGGTVAQSSYANGVSDGMQVGNAFVDDVSRASFWSNTANSWMDLHPVGAVASGLSATSGEQQVGHIFDGNTLRAGLWNGTAESWTDLHPAGALASVAYRVDANEQVGYIGLPGNISHAALWRDTAASFVDLHPEGATHSSATGVHAGLQVGSAMFSGVHRASLWSGTSESWEDLSLALIGSWGESAAFGIWSDTTTTYVTGHGFNLATGRYEALLWTRPLAGPTLSGDYNNDGSVDAADYVVWRKGLGTTYTHDDYNDWQANFGATLGSGAGAGSSDHAISPIVPEPATVLLLVFGAAVMCFSVRQFREEFQ